MLPQRSGATLIQHFVQVKLATYGARLQNVTFVHFAMLSMIIENKHNIGITIDMKLV